jgi:hypothetical protein
MNKKTQKLAEAKYFYDRMVEVQNTVVSHNREYFIYNFSAFLSASRSVLQYMLEEIEQKKDPIQQLEARQWYDKKMAASPRLKFFKDKRDINIHVSPIKPIGHIIAIVPGPVAFRYSFSVKRKPEKEVLPLCLAYLTELENFINNGVSKGYITP